MLADYFHDANERGIMRVPHPRLVAGQFVVLVGPAMELLEQRLRGYDEDEWIEAVVTMFDTAYFID